MLITKLGYSLFSLSHRQKMKIETIQNRRSRILQVKDNKYFMMRHTLYTEKCFVQSLKLYMEMPSWYPFEGHKINRAFLQKQ